jgi:hypothetical protein
VHKPGRLVIDAGGVPPAQVIGEPVDRLPVRAALCTITTARIDGGTDRRPYCTYRSANRAERMWRACG